MVDAPDIAHVDGTLSMLNMSRIQEGVCNWGGQLGGRGVIIITCADQVPGKNSIPDLGRYFLGLEL